MNFDLMNEKFKNCTCSREHSCPIEYICIGKGAIKQLEKMCCEYKNILLVSDVNTYKVCGKDVFDLIRNKISASVVLAPNPYVVVPNEEKINEIQDKITPDTDFIIGVGSGVINDLCKYVSFKNNLEYCIVATAPSMDGYASTGSALILGGMKVTLSTHVPKIIIGDTDVLKNAPMEMIKAGYGDIVGKYSCLNDWKLSALVNDEYFCEEIYNLVMSMAESVRGYAKKLLEREDNAIKALMEALVTVGVAMSYVGNSRPASGSEHHLSHFFEITGILDNKEYYPHGIDVVYSACVTAKIREKIVNSFICEYNFDRDEWIKNIKRVYSTSADEVIALQDKLKWYNVDDKDNIVEKIDKIKEILNQAPTFSESIGMLEEIGLSYDEFVDFYGKEKIDDAVLYSKDLKDRYTVLWLYYKYFSLEVYDEEYKTYGI